MKHNINSIMQNLICWALYLSLVVDTINGVILRSTTISISPVYKAAIIIAILVNLKSRQLYLELLTITTISLGSHFIILGDVSDALKSQDWIIKFIFIYTCYKFFKSIIINQNEGIILKLATFSFSILAFNLILGSLGFGYSQYTNGDDAGIGTKGFLYAGNEIAGAMVASTAILLIFSNLNGKKAKYIFTGLLSVSLCALAATKASIGAVLLLLLMLPLLNNSKANTSNNLAFKIFIILAFPVISAIAIYYAVFESNLITRLSYHYERVGLFTLIFSHRNIWADEAITHLSQNYSLLELIFGAGNTWRSHISTMKSIEIDPLDTLMTYGALGVFIVYGFILNTLLISFKNKKNPCRRQVQFSIILVILISSTAGHIVFSGTAGPLIAALLSLSSYRRVHARPLN